MNGAGGPDSANHAERGPERPEEDRIAPRRRRRWLRGSLLVFAGTLAILCAAAVWLALDPGLRRPAAERIATVITGHPVIIGALDLRLGEGAAVIEARDVRIGQTTTERVRISLAGMRSHADGDGVRFPNGSSVDHFRASIDLSLTGRPRISTVDATGAVLVAARREPSHPAGPPPLARLLVIPRVLLGLGLERLVVHSGEIQYRGRSATQTAGMTAEFVTTDRGLALRGELLGGPGIPPLPFDGTVRNAAADDWEIEVRLTGDRVPMEGVRVLTSVLEPGPAVRTMLRRISNETRFLLSIRLSRARIDTVTLDFTFGARGESDEGEVSLEGVRFLARAIPDSAGWTVAGEVDWSRLPGGADAEQSPFVVRWSNGIPGSLRWSARRVAVPLLAHLAGDTLPPEHALRPALERLRPAGMIDELAAIGNPAARGDPASFWLSAVLSGFGATAGGLQIADAGARIEFAGGEWRVRFVDDHLQAAIPSFRNSPYELTLRGEIRVTTAGQGWAAHTGGLEVGVAGIAGRIEGSLGIPLPGLGGAPALDAEIRLDDLALKDIEAILPDRRAVGFTHWYRRAVRSGRLTGATLRIRGDPRSIPFPEGDGGFEARGTVREAELAYARGWPPARVAEAAVRANGPVLEFLDIRGTIFDTAIDKGFARIRDITNPEGRVQVSLAGTGPAGDLLAFVRASPLGARAGARAGEFRADGPASTTVELDAAYGRNAGGRRIGVSGKIEIGGVAVNLTTRRAVLEDIRGTLAFDAKSLSGGPLQGRLHGAEIESHVEFTRDEGLRIRFSGEGDGDWFGVVLNDLVNLDEERTGPWLSRLHGRTSWNAEYDSRAGVVFRSDLRTASVDFPAPFDKPAGTVRRLEVVVTPGEAEWRIDAGYGPEARAVFEIAETAGKRALARAGVALGGARPTLPTESHVEISGRLPELDLDPWFALRSTGSAGAAGWLSRIGRIDLETSAARAFGRRIKLRRLSLTPVSDGHGFHVRLAGEGVAGEVLLPVDPASERARIHLERLHIGESLEEGEDGDSPDDEDAAADIRMDGLPSFDARIDSLRFEKIDLGAVRATGKRTGNGFEIEELSVDSSDFRMRGRGSWLAGDDATVTSRFEGKLNTEDLSRILLAAGLGEETVAGGAIEVRFELAWPGSPFELSLERIEGRIEMDAEDGHLPRVPVGAAGRLLALLSLDALTRVLALDLSHVVGKGFVYDWIVARTHLEDGSAKIRELTISGPSGRIEVSGGLDLVSREYDQEVSVIPRLTRSGALLPIWAVAWPVLVGNFLLEKISGDEVLLDRLFSLRYRLHGPWDNPEIDRIKSRTASTGK